MTDIPTSKVCTKCGEEKPLDSYNNRRGARDGKRADCKDCLKSLRERYREGNREKILEGKRQHYRRNREAIRERQRSAHAEKMADPERAQEVREARRRDYRNNREQYLRRSRDSQVRRKEIRAEYMRMYVDRNRESINKRIMDRYRRLYKTDAKFTASVAARNFLRRCTHAAFGKPQVREYSETLGYTADDLRARMEVQFQPGMAWENYGEWHIDHKIPVSRMLGRGEDRMHIINALSNLQPMWAEENMRKGARWVG